MPIALTNPHCSLAAAAAATSMHRCATAMIGICFILLHLCKVHVLEQENLKLLFHSYTFQYSQINICILLVENSSTFYFDEDSR